MTNRELFLNHIGQTSDAPLCLEIVKAKDCKMWDADGKEYIDLISGISVSNIGHCNQKVIQAVKDQLDRYMHIMVNGEMVLSPQVQYAQMLTSHLPASLNSVFYTASGTEATEGAMKLAKRATGRTEIISFKNSYHGSTQGALSLMGDEYWRNAFRPLLPDTRQLDYNSIPHLDHITNATACVIAETVQAEAGVLIPRNNWLKALRKKCSDVGALLVLDEIQCGFGRNGSMWAFQFFDVIPDVLLLGKALGGGMPMGAFIADKNLLDLFTLNPVLGHINTFGGHPVCCTAGMKAMEVMIDENLIDSIAAKEQLFLKLLVHPRIKAVRSCGLMIAIEFKSFKENKSIIDKLIIRGVFTDWFLFASNCLRIAPPLIITEEEIIQSCTHLLAVLNEVE